MIFFQVKLYQLEDLRLLRDLNNKHAVFPTITDERPFQF